MLAFRASRYVLPVVAIAALTAGCGGGGATIDHTVVETAIATSIARQQHLLAVVSCPKGVEAKRGRRFTCTATLRSGRQLPISVTAADDEGNVKYEGFEGFSGGRPDEPRATTTEDGGDDRF